MGAPLRILEISPSFDPAHAFGGPIVSTRDLCRALAADGACEIRVLTTDAASPTRAARLAVPAGWHRHPAGFLIRYCRWALPPDLSPGLLVALVPALRWAEAVHLNGVYSFTTPATLLLARLLGRPVLWSPRGALMDPGHGEGRVKRLWDRAC
ncbi:MAG: glycosyl transferase family 1, partial [Alphaproteobacteria bacterium]|nr:glycosyl transferase family 1 [Alphaproteobacteria bacterium]